MEKARMERWWAAIGVMAMLVGQPIALADPVMNDAQSAKTDIEDFYRWYLVTDHERPPALSQKAISRWVAPKLLGRLRSDLAANRFAGDADYFLESQDPDVHWAQSVEATPVADINGEVIVKLTLGSPEGMQLCIHARKMGRFWKISQVDDSDRKADVFLCRPNEGHVFVPPL